MIGLVPVDRHTNIEVLDLVPFGRDLANRACNELNADAFAAKDRQQRVQFAKPNEGLAADDRDMERPMSIYQFQNAVDQVLRFVIGKRAKRSRAAKMDRFIGITSRTPQRAFACYLDRKGRILTGKYFAPSTNNVYFLHQPSPETV